jgi:hypothetical protein
MVLFGLIWDRFWRKGCVDRQRLSRRGECHRPEPATVVMLLAGILAICSRRFSVVP